MPGKGKFSGFYWHHEFHTVDPKKKKAADCIYLSEDRICRNSDCFLNGEKCFVATHCKYRKRVSTPSSAAPEESEWRCSLPIGCVVFSKTQGVGEYIGCTEEHHMITVKYDTCTKSYLYPDAFIKHQLYGNQEVSECVLADSKR